MRSHSASNQFQGEPELRQIPVRHPVEKGQRSSAPMELLYNDRREAPFDSQAPPRYSEYPVQEEYCHHSATYPSKIRESMHCLQEGAMWKISRPRFPYQRLKEEE